MHECIQIFTCEPYEVQESCHLSMVSLATLDYGEINVLIHWCEEYSFILPMERNVAVTTKITNARILWPSNSTSRDLSCKHTETCEMTLYTRLFTIALLLSAKHCCPSKCISTGNCLNYGSAVKQSIKNSWKKMTRTFYMY